LLLEYLTFESFDRSPFKFNLIINLIYTKSFYINSSFQSVTALRLELSLTSSVTGRLHDRFKTVFKQNSQKRPWNVHETVMQTTSNAGRSETFMLNMINVSKYSQNLVYSTVAFQLNKVILQTNFNVNRVFDDLLSIY
jgi:hypothetical protein